MKPLLPHLTTMVFSLTVGTLLCASSLAASAIAVDTHNGAWASAYGNRACRTLEKLAVAQCRSHGGRHIDALSTSEKGYAALARGRSGSYRFGWAAGCKTQAEADRLALRKVGYRNASVVARWNDR